MGALNAKKDSFKFRQWRLRQDDMVDLFDNVPSRVTWNTESLDHGTVRSVFNWLSNSSRYGLKNDFERPYESEHPILTSFNTIFR